MKKIHLIRHAKSSWKNPRLADIDRPLNKRGMSTSAFMASPIHKAGCQFTHVFCSPAVRAQSTIATIASCLPEINIEWQTDNALYTFDSNDLYQWCQSLDELISELVIIGHNPAFTDFCNELSHSHIRNIPTCGYAQLTTHSNNTWQQISTTHFELTTFIRPKKLMAL